MMQCILIVTDPNIIKYLLILITEEVLKRFSILKSRLSTVIVKAMQMLLQLPVLVFVRNALAVIMTMRRVGEAAGETQHRQNPAGQFGESWETAAHLPFHSSCVMVHFMLLK